MNQSLPIIFRLCHVTFHFFITTIGFFIFPNYPPYISKWLFLPILSSRRLPLFFHFSLNSPFISLIFNYPFHFSLSLCIRWFGISSPSSSTTVHHRQRLIFFFFFLSLFFCEYVNMMFVAFMNLSVASFF